jgi:hypothetical protein
MLVSEVLAPGRGNFITADGKFNCRKRHTSLQGERMLKFLGKHFIAGEGIAADVNFIIRRGGLICWAWKFIFLNHLG